MNSNRVHQPKKNGICFGFFLCRWESKRGKREDVFFDVWHRSKENSIKIIVERREQGRELCLFAFHESSVKCVACLCEPKEMDMSMQSMDEMALVITFAAFAMNELWPKPSMRPVIPQPNFDTMRASVLQAVQSLFCSCCLKIWVSSTCMMRTWFRFLVRVIMVLFFGSTSDSSMMNVSEFLRNYGQNDWVPC